MYKQIIFTNALASVPSKFPLIIDFYTTMTYFHRYIGVLLTGVPKVIYKATAKIGQSKMLC